MGHRPFETHYWKRIRRIAGITCVLLLIGFLGFGLVIDRYGRQDRAQPADAIVVLGARVDEGGLASDSLRARALHATILYHQGLAPAIICTGGVGDFPPAEAVVAANIAKHQGVPASVIFLETRSTSTRENALFAAEICRKHGWTRVIVVSDPYHLYRAHRDFVKAGLTTFTSPALECARQMNGIQRFVWTAREVGLVLRDVMLLR